MLGITFLPYLLLEMMYQCIYCFKYFTIDTYFCLLRIFMRIFRQERGHNISHLWSENLSHKAIWLKFRPSFTKLLRNLTIISICGKTRLQQLRKIKYSILASVLHIFDNFFLAEPHTHLHNTLCKSHDFLVFCFESWHIFQILWLFGKIHFAILFCTYKI